MIIQDDNKLFLFRLIIIANNVDQSDVLELDSHCMSAFSISLVYQREFFFNDFLQIVEPLKMGLFSIRDRYDNHFDDDPLSFIVLKTQFN